LYPNVIDVPIDDFSTPLQLLAQRIEFEDPVSGTRHEFVSRRQLWVSSVRRPDGCAADRRQL
jgi:tRNA pseudouridine32 synthase/23S rRNA pseudouridine746 synthase